MDKITEDFLKDIDFLKSGIFQYFLLEDSTKRLKPVKGRIGTDKGNC